MAILVRNRNRFGWGGQSYRYFRIITIAEPSGGDPIIMQWTNSFGVGYSFLNMTSDVLPVPLVASAAGFLPGWNPFKAFDGDVTTTAVIAPLGDNGAWFIKIDYGAGGGGILISYKLYGEPTGLHTRNLQNWDLHGSNDNSDWMILDQQRGITWVGGAGEVKEFFL